MVTMVDRAVHAATMAISILLGRAPEPAVDAKTVILLVQTVHAEPARVPVRLESALEAEAESAHRLDRSVAARRRRIVSAGGNCVPRHSRLCRTKIRIGHDPVGRLIPRRVGDVRPPGQQSVPLLAAAASAAIVMLPPTVAVVAPARPSPAMCLRLGIAMIGTAVAVLDPRPAQAVLAGLSPRSDRLQTRRPVGRRVAEIGATMRAVALIATAPVTGLEARVLTTPGVRQTPSARRGVVTVPVGPARTGVVRRGQVAGVVVLGVAGRRPRSGAGRIPYIGCRFVMPWPVG